MVEIGCVLVVPSMLKKQQQSFKLGVENIFDFVRIFSPLSFVFLFKTLVNGRARVVVVDASRDEVC